MGILPAIPIKLISLCIYSTSIAYVHLRGKDRLKFLRQLTDHSSLMAPINALLYLCSSVPRQPYLEVSQFPELAVLRDNWTLIRDEAIKLYQDGYIAASSQFDDLGFNSFFRRGWKRFYLKWYNDPLPSASLCPKTLALIQSIPSINAAMFALLPSKGTLGKHRDPYAGSLRYHLGLVTPNSPKCCIYVDGQPYYWRDGADVLFDETYLHFAENMTEQDRLILFCDVKRPLNNPLARYLNTLFSKTIMKAASSKNLPSERVGFINILFKYVYQIRLVGKRLKAYNKRLYYVVKSILFLTIFYFLFIPRG